MCDIIAHTHTKSLGSRRVKFLFVFWYLVYMLIVVCLQVFAADRPCKSCDMNMTKVRTPHWEGGAGCRDKISMSR
jgi:hypothetical protein